MPEKDKTSPVAIGKARGWRIDSVMADVIGDRSARVLAAAADRVLAASRSRRPAEELGRLAETLMQHAAVQDLIVGCGNNNLVKIDHRLETLARGLVDIHPGLDDVDVRVDRVSVAGRSARWLAVVTREIIDSYADDPNFALGTGIVLDLSLDGNIVVIAAAGGVGGPPSLHLDGARRLVVAMGGHFREKIDDGVRAIEVSIPCRVSDRGSLR